MCGIIGIAARTHVVERAWLAAGRDAMQHRGPDGAGEHWSQDGRVGFGHRRLAIIDLSDAGHQPMQDAGKTLCIVLNGEIYNFQSLRRELEDLGHVFRSASDTEVVLLAYRQWGEDCVRRLEGMFAFAIHDVQRATVFMARDRAGEKPFFYRAGRGELRFASELKALMADATLPREVDPDALDSYLAFGYNPGARCMLKGYMKLPAAHAMRFDCATGAVHVYRYWSLPELVTTDGPSSEDDLVRVLEFELEGSVRRQLVADVPVGLLLSGGMDSSLITALAARATGKIRTFTVGYKDEPDYDETRHADLIARHFGTQHTVLTADAPGDEILTQLARQYDEPIVDSSMIPTFLVTREIARHCKVALGGDGGDELFGGYHSASQIATLEARRNSLPTTLCSAISRAAAHLPRGFKGRQKLAYLGLDPAADVLPYLPRFNVSERRRLMAKAAQWQPVAEAHRRARIPADVDAVQRMTRFDFANYLPDDILVKVDRASMLNSLEVRAPFLDARIIDFAYGRVQSASKANPAGRKLILRKLAQRILPAGFDAARKQGFGFPVDRMLRAGRWRQVVDDALADPDCIFDRAAVGKLLRLLDGGSAVGEAIFAIGMFELWRKEYRVTL